MSLRRVPVLAAALTAVLGATILVAQQAAADTAPRAAARAAAAGARVAATAPVDTSGPHGSMRLTGSAAVALTFDDGPDPVVTPRLLDLLKEQRVKATFCVVGHRARDNPAIIRRMADEGHTLCNHSWQHLEDLGVRDEATIRKDLTSTSTWIRRAVPGVPIPYFRAPYGNFTARLNTIARDMGMTPLSWSVDDQSWASEKYGKGDELIAHMTGLVKTNTRQGSIILSHEMAKPWTVTAYRSLLPWLTARFELIPLPAPSLRPRPAPLPPRTSAKPTFPAVPRR